MGLFGKNKQISAELDDLQRRLDYERQRANELDTKLSQAQNQNNSLENETYILKQKNKLLSERLDDEAMHRFVAEMERLKMFILRWENAFNQGLITTENAKKTLALSEQLKNILNDGEVIYNVNQASQKITKLSNSIRSFQSSVDYSQDEDFNGFNIDEVLNPKGDLNLEELCKDLGVME